MLISERQPTFPERFRLPKTLVLTAVCCFGMKDSGAALRPGLGNAAAHRSAHLVDKAGVALATYTVTNGGGGGGGGGGTTSARFKWRYQGEPVYYSSPAIGTDGTVYFATGGHFVYFNGYWSQGQKPPAKAYGLYASYPNGTLKWKYTDGTDAPARGSPVMATDGTIYIVLERLTATEYATTQELHAVNPDGTSKWKHTFGTHYAEIGTLTPALASDGTIYVAGFELTAFNPDGTVKWTASHGGSNSFYGSPAIGSDGTIYTVYWATAQVMQALNPDGTVKWTATEDLGTIPITCSPSLAADGTIYIGSTDTALPGQTNGTLWAFDSNGAFKWKYNSGDLDIRSSPAIDTDGTIYVGGKGSMGYINAIHPDGTLKWRHSSLSDALPGANVDVYSSPIIGTDGTIYIANEWGWIYAFNPDGTIKWKDNTIQQQGGTNWSSGALAADGTMYLGNTYGEFLAFTTDSLGMSTTAQWPKYRYSNDNNGRLP